MPTTHTPEPFVTEGISFPESPRWRDGRLWFTDMYVRCVCYAEQDGSVTTVTEVPSDAGGIGWLPSGDLLVASMEEKRIMRLGPGADELVEYVDLSSLADGPINDMYVTPDGGIYIGNFGAAKDEPQTRPMRLPVEPTPLIYVAPDGEARLVGDALDMPNGAVRRPDGNLVVAESYGGRIIEYTVDADGSLTNKRVVVDLGTDTIPDGICMDGAEGIWVASPLPGTHVVRVDRSGEITDRIEINATACAVGGPEGKTLFLCGSEFDDVAEIMRGASKGYIRTLALDLPPAPAPSP